VLVVYTVVLASAAVSLFQVRDVIGASDA
jgi:hypothetical protein